MLINAHLGVQHFEDGQDVHVAADLSPEGPGGLPLLLLQGKTTVARHEAIDLGEESDTAVNIS